VTIRTEATGKGKSHALGFMLEQITALPPHPPLLKNLKSTAETAAARLRMRLGVFILMRICGIEICSEAVD
jgi:hypothetical protein